MAVDRYQSGVQHSDGAHPGRASRHRPVGGSHSHRGLSARAHGHAKGLAKSAAGTSKEQTHHPPADR